MFIYFFFHLLHTRTHTYSVEDESDVAQDENMRMGILFNKITSICFL